MFGHTNNFKVYVRTRLAAEWEALTGCTSKPPAVPHSAKLHVSALLEIEHAIGHLEDDHIVRRD